MPRDSKVYLEDILRAAASVRSYVEGLSHEAFLRDAKTVDAVIRNLEIIGEAVKQVPPEVRAKAPEIDWQKIAGLRDVLIHAYSTVDLDIVWDVVANKLPSLEPRVRELLGEG